MSMYSVAYNDMSYMTYEFTDEQYDKLKNGIMAGSTGVNLVGIGLFILKDIRSVIIQKPAPIENESFTPDLTEEEKEHIAYIKWAEQMALLDKKDETEYEGGMMP